MQNEKINDNETVMIPVPTKLLLEAGIYDDDPMQMYADGRKIIIQNIDDAKDFVCDSDCENCPIADTDCDGDCESCPCNNNCDESEAN